MDIKLTAAQAHFVKRIIESGNYQDEGDVISQALTLLEEREAKDDKKLKHLQDLVRTVREDDSPEKGKTYDVGEIDKMLDDCGW